MILTYKHSANSLAKRHFMILQTHRHRHKNTLAAPQSSK